MRNLQLVWIQTEKLSGPDITKFKPLISKPHRVYLYHLYITILLLCSIFLIYIPTISSTETGEVVDGERLQVATKELGNCEIFPQTLQHNPNGRFVVVCGDGEYIIYTALAWRNKSFGSALEFVWASETGE